MGYLPITSNWSGNCRSRHPDSFCTGRQVSRKQVNEYRAHKVEIVETCVPPPTVVVESALMLELLLEPVLLLVKVDNIRLGSDNGIVVESGTLVMKSLRIADMEK
jgi:hypothetical protein